jgi:hypothetical protein
MPRCGAAVTVVHSHAGEGRTLAGLPAWFPVAPVGLDQKSTDIPFIMNTFRQNHPVRLHYTYRRTYVFTLKNLLARFPE